MHLRRRFTRIHLSDLIHLLHHHQEYRRHVSEMLPAGAHVGVREVGEGARGFVQCAAGSATEWRGSRRAGLAGVYGSGGYACGHAVGGWAGLFGVGGEKDGRGG